MSSLLAESHTIHEIVVARDRTEHATMAAELLARAIEGAVSERGIARIALSGGNTPSEAYQRLAAMRLPFDRIEWYWVDERAVPQRHPRSNFTAAARDLGLESSAHGKAFPMEADVPDRDAAARSYEARLRKAFGVAAAVAFDAMTLGIGDDGHTASLFPGLGVVAIDDRLVTAIPEQPDKGLEPRLSLTTPVLLEAKLVLVLALGASKQKVVAAAREAGSEEEIPARLLQRAKGRVVFVLDKDAAG